MSSIIFYLSFLLAFDHDTLCRERFFEAAFRDTSSASLILLKVNITDSTGAYKKVLIPNRTLYLFFKENENMNYHSYNKFMRDFYDSNDTLKYTKFGSMPGYLQLKPDNYIQRFQKKGKKKFIDKFFKNGIFKYQYQKHFESIVAQLFDYGVLVSTLDNGVIAITYKCD